MNLVYPRSLLSFTSISWQVRDVSRTGGPSVLGSEQIVNSPAGRWWASLTLAVGALSWNGSDDLLAFRGLMARLRGRARVVDVPFFDGRDPAFLWGAEPRFALHSDGTTFSDGARYRTPGLSKKARHADGTTFSDGSAYSQTAVPVSLASASQMNDTVLTLRFPIGLRPQVGQCFTLPGGWMHAVADIVAVSGRDWSVEVSPWLRDDYALGAHVEVDNPTSRMRLVSDDSGALGLQAAQGWSSPTIEFVEAF